MPIEYNYFPKIIKRFNSGIHKSNVLWLNRILILAALLVLASCNPAKKVKKGDYLLVKNNVNVIYGNDDKQDKKAVNSIFDKESFNEIIKQKPNHKIIGVFRFHLAIHNDIDTAKLRRDVIKKHEKLLVKNKKREAKEKKIKKYKKPWRQWLAEDVGEAPVVYDTSLAKRTVEEFNFFLYNRGFFNPEITYYTKQDTSSQKLKVFYDVEPGVPNRINRIEFIVPNADVRYIIDQEIVRRIL